MQASSLQNVPVVVDQYVEYICAQGCVKVTACIDAMQNNEDLPELAGLTREERRTLLDELVSIMSVYSGSCSR